MTITMQNYGLTWTSPTGESGASAVAYDQPTAEKRKTELETAGCTGVEIVPVRPGQLPDPRA